ncbi:MAG TPA: hypothetical protein VM389_06470, partial [Phycisphaerae bacterium]|nr:hypothetical protein [Phycisphaerae bacterium]
MSVVAYDYNPAGAPIDPRNHFLPPRYHVRRLGEDTDASWETIPPVAVLCDAQGEEIRPHSARIRLAWDDAHLYLRAACEETRFTADPARCADFARFWEQDHVELRFTPDPARPLKQIQFIIIPDGRFWDNQGLWKQDGAVALDGEVTDSGWCLSVRIPFAAMGLPVPKVGAVLQGFVANCRWADRWPDISGISPAELGFAQADRHAELVFDGPDTGAVLLDRIEFDRRILRCGPNAAVATLVNTADAPIPGRLRITREKGPDTPGHVHSRDVEIAPGPNALPFQMDLDRPQFNRYRFSLCVDGRTRELAAVTLRGGVPDLDPAALKIEHPYLYFTPQRLEE